MLICESPANVNTCFPQLSPLYVSSLHVSLYSDSQSDARFDLDMGSRVNDIQMTEVTNPNRLTNTCRPTNQAEVICHYTDRPIL